jgi:hypothetical protein
VRLAVVVLAGACSFTHGNGATDAPMRDATDAPIDAPRPTSPRKLVFDNSASGVDFGPHPVMLALNPSNIDYSVIANPKTDLRFEYATAGMTANVGDNVPFEIEQWVPGGESIVWIRVPELLRASTDTAVLMHFGPTAGGTESGDATWQSWELVNHMTSTLTSSTGTYMASATNVAFGPGPLGDAVAFLGNGDQRLTFFSGSNLFDGWSVYFMSFWIYLDYDSAADLAGEPKVMDKGTSINLGRLYPRNGEIVFQLDQHYSGSNNDVFINTVIQPKTWTNIALVFDGYGTWFANNAVAGPYADLTGNQQTLLGSSAQFYLGHATNAFKGMIDELHIERRARSLDFIRAQYLIGTRKFVTITDP